MRPRSVPCLPLIGAILLTTALPAGAAPAARIFAWESAGESSPVTGGMPGWPSPEAVRVDDREMAFGGRWTPGLRNETLFLTGRFNGGWTVTVGFFGWTYKLFQGWGLYALLSEPDGTAHYYRLPVDRRDVEVDRERLDIRAGDNRIEGSREETRVRLTVDDFHCDLRFRNLLPPWRPGDGLADIAPRENVSMRLVVPIPWAELSGKLTVDGREMEVRGDGYSDLSRLISPPDRTNSPITCLRAWSPDSLPFGERWLLSVVEYVAHPEYEAPRLPVLILARGGRWVLTTPSFTLQVLESKEVDGLPYPWPARLAVRAEDRGFRLEGEIVFAEPYLVNDLFADLTPLARAMARTFTDRSVIFRLRGEFRGTLRTPDGGTVPLRLSGPGEYLANR